MSSPYKPDRIVGIILGLSLAWSVIGAFTRTAEWMHREAPVSWILFGILNSLFGLIYLSIYSGRRSGFLWQFWITAPLAPMGIWVNIYMHRGTAYWVVEGFEWAVAIYCGLRLWLNLGPGFVAGRGPFGLRRALDH
jgi:hypothetical protein